MALEYVATNVNLKDFPLAFCFLKLYVIFVSV